MGCLLTLADQKGFRSVARNFVLAIGLLNIDLPSTGERYVYRPFVHSANC